MTVTSVRRFRRHGQLPDRHAKDIDLALLPTLGMILEFSDGGRATVGWLVLRADGTLEVGTESEAPERRTAALGAGWKPLDEP